jgi:hypothetical protein
LNWWCTGRHGDVSIRGGTVNAGLVPQPLCNADWVEIHRHPPCRLIASPMEGAMMGPAERDRKLVADPAPQGPWLHEPQVMRVRRAPSADKAGLCSNELEVRTVAVTAGFAQRERGFVDMPGSGIVHPAFSLCGCGSRLNPNLNHSQFWRRGWHLPTRPPIADTRRCGSFAWTRRFLRSAEFNAGAERGQQRDAARNLGRFSEFRVAGAGCRRRGEGGLRRIITR